MKVITSKIFKGKKMFLIDDENYQDGGVIEDTSVDESKEFLKNWYLNRKEIPEFKDISENFLKQLPLVKNIEYKGHEPYSKKGNVYMLPSTNKFVKNHEYTHAIHFRASGYNYGKNIINSVTNKSDKYLSDPTEVYARLNVLRQSLNLDPLKKYNLEETKEILNNANKIGQKSSQGVLNSLENGDYSNTPSNNGNEEQIFELLKVIDNKPENLQKLLNEIALNNQKTDNFKNLAKYGKVIEDNQGQWKYPGQITKINSNNITMKGVPYPVYGVSDVGDKQMMYPNGEYKFKGNSVTEYPILAQAGTTVKINKDNIIREYDIRSPEYKQMYDSGNLMSYDKTTDTYTATPLKTVEVTAKAPQWLIDKRNIEKNFTKEKFVKKYLPKWSGSMGETADNLSENAQKDYDKKVNDKLANVLLKSNQKKGNKEANNLDWYNSFSEKEREIIQQSSLANKFAPAQRAYDLDVSNSTKKYNTTDVLTDADKLSQSVQGTPERFRLFPNAENNIESYVNPGMFLGSMAKGLGNVPKDIKNENYGQAALSIATPLGVGALAGIGNPSTKQFVNNIVNPLAGTGNLIKSKIINNLKNINYELSTIPKKINPFYQSKVNKELQIGNQWQDDWYNHPDTKKRLEDLSYEFSIPEIERIKDKNYISEMNRRNPLNLKGFTKEEINNIYKIYPLTPSHNSWDEILNRIDNKNYLTKFQTKDSKLQKILKGEKRLHDGNYGVSGYNLDNTFRGERQNFVDKYSPKIKSTTIHEGNHGLTDGNDLLDYAEQKNIGKIFGEDYSIPKRDIKGEFNSYDEYLQDPTEVYARIMELRNYMKIKPNQVLDSDLFNKMIEKGIEGKTPVEKTFFKLIKNTDHFRSLFNRLPLLIPGAMGLESISQMEEKEFGGKILNTKIENGKKYFLINE
jgi:hypothetical protein